MYRTHTNGTKSRETVINLVLCSSGICHRQVGLNATVGNLPKITTGFNYISRVQSALVLVKSERLELRANILRTL